MDGEQSSDDDGESQPQQEQSTYCLSLEKQQSDYSVNEYDLNMCQYGEDKDKEKSSENIEDRDMKSCGDQKFNEALGGFSKKFILEQYQKFKETKKQQLIEKDKKLRKFVQILEEILEKLELSFTISKKVIENLNFFKSNSYENISMAIIMLSCKNQQIPLPLKRIISLNKMSNNLKEISLKCVNKCIKKIKEVYQKYDNSEMMFDSYDPSALINQIANLFKERSQNEMHMNLLKISQLAKSYSSKNYLKSTSHAITISVCAFWMSSYLQQSPIILNELCQEIGIHSQAIRNFYREIYPYRIYLVCGKSCVPQEVEKFVNENLVLN